MEIGEMCCNFSWEIVLAPTLSIRLNRVTSKTEGYIFEDLSIYI